MNPTLIVSIFTMAIIAVVLMMKFSNNTSLKENAILNVVLVFAALGVVFLSKAGQSLDVEIWNGEVTGKSQERVSCSHSYTCNCRSETTCTGSGQNRSCSTSTTCDTCYEHTHDYNWVVHSNIGNQTIDRIDRQGVYAPPRWQSVVNGEPFAMKHLHMNYIKGASKSLFNNKDVTYDKFKNMIPTYPSDVYDYYRINRAISVGVPVPDLQLWSSGISEILKQLGPQKQANVIIVFANTNDHDYEYALRSAWLGGKKNDVIVIVGATQYPKIDFIRVMSWTDQEIFKIKLRDALQDLQEIDRVAMLSTIRAITQGEFKRKQMKDFEYLDNEVDVPTWAIITGFAIIALGNLAYIFVNRSSRNSFNKKKFRYR